MVPPRNLDGPESNFLYEARRPRAESEIPYTWFPNDRYLVNDSPHPTKKRLLAGLAPERATAK